MRSTALDDDSYSHTNTHVQRRLEHGVAEELLPLFRIGPDLVHAHRARALFDAGFKTHEDLAMVMMGCLVPWGFQQTKCYVCACSKLCCNRFSLT